MGHKTDTNRPMDEHAKANERTRQGEIANRGNQCKPQTAIDFVLMRTRTEKLYRQIMTPETTGNYGSNTNNSQEHKTQAHTRILPPIDRHLTAGP